MNGVSTDLLPMNVGNVLYCVAYYPMQAKFMPSVFGKLWPWHKALDRTIWNGATKSQLAKIFRISFYIALQCLFSLFRFILVWVPFVCH